MDLAYDRHAQQLADLFVPSQAQVQFERIRLYPKQAAIVEDARRFTMCEATSKAGKTCAMLEWLLDNGIHANEGNWWWVATINETADIAFRRAIQRLRGYIDSGGRLKRIADPIPFEKNLTRKIITVGGATFWFRSADHPDALFGEDVRAAVGDEITRWKEDAWFALYTTLTATKGRAKLIGNVKGKKNFAYKLARKAEAGEPDWGYHKLTAHDAIDGGVIEPDIVDQAQRDLPDSVFRELYLAEPADDVGNPFGLVAIRACIAPLSLALPTSWGWDLAKSLDWTVGVGLDQFGATCRFERWQKSALPPGFKSGTEYWEATQDRIRTLTGKTPALVDSTGVGDPVFEALAKHSNMEGFKFTQQSKQQIMEGLAVAIQQHEVTFPDGVIVDELEAFEYQYGRTGVRYGAAEGMHDDAVCALALAVECWKRHRSTRPSVPVVPVPSVPSRMSLPGVIRIENPAHPDYGARNRRKWN